MSAQNSNSTGRQDSSFNRRYLLQSTLGRGGMGIVYTALDRLTGKRVALKRVLAPWEFFAGDIKPDTTELRLALAQEFQVLASLLHPNIIGVLDYGFDHNRRPYFTLDLLEHAQPITEAIGNNSFAVQIDYLAQLLRALVYLHQRQILHRDLKPNNVLVDNGLVKVVDFGLSINTTLVSQSEDNAAGTLPYIAPELLLGKLASPASDLYSVGVITYELFAGKRPFEPGEQVMLLVDKIIYEPPDLTVLNVNDALRQFIRRLLEKDPYHRFQSAKEAFYELQQATGQPLKIETKSTREGFLQASQYIGRDRELAILLSALTAAAKGSGSTHLIAGESGIGKSRLFHELKTRAQVEGTVVISGQSVTESATPYQLWRECFRWLVILVDLNDDEASVLKAVVPDIAVLLGREVADPPTRDPFSAQANLHQTISQLLARQPNPLVIFLEDLQWATEEDIALLAHVSPSVSSIPVLILGNYRDEDQPNLASRLAVMQFMKLDRLTEPEIVALSQSMLGTTKPAVADLLVKQTEGNVYFLVEIVRALAEEAGQLDAIGQQTLPPSIFTGGIQRIVTRRLDQILPENRELLGIAAVAGREIDLPVLRTVVTDEVLASWLLSCATVAVLEMQDERWRFVHDKLREGVLLNLEVTRRTELHRQVAAAIERAYPQQEAQAARLAYHWGLAGNFDAAVHYSLIAARLAYALYAINEAHSHYSAAIVALSKMPDSLENRRLRIDTMINQTVLGLTLVEPKLYLEQLAEIERLARTLPFAVDINANNDSYAPDQLRWGKIQLQFGRAQFNVSNLPEAIRYFQEALRIGRKYDDNQLILQPSATLGRIYAVQGRYAEAQPLLDSACALLANNGQDHQWALTAQTLGLVRAGRGHCSEALELLSAARDRARILNDFQVVTLTHTVASGIYLAIYNDYEAAAREAYESINVASKIKDLISLYMPYGYAAWAESRRGNHIRAAQYREQANAIANALGGFLLWTDSFFAVEAELEFNAGQRTQALVLAEKALNFAIQVSSQLNQVRMHRLLGLIWASTDWGKSVTHFETGIKIADSVEMRMEAVNIQVSWGNALLKRGENEAAHNLLGSAVVQCRQSELPLRIAEIERLLSKLPGH